jgi:hypothetical protein
MEYFTVLFFGIVAVLLPFLVFQAINIWQSRPHPVPPSGTSQGKQKGGSYR